VSAPVLSEIRVAADPAAWRGAGFSVTDTSMSVGDVSIEFVEGDGGIVDWTLADDAPVLPSTAHANGVTEIDHVVMLTPSLERTIADLEAQGIELRRIREGRRRRAGRREARAREGRGPARPEDRDRAKRGRSRPAGRADQP
jgi:hypothetical protein